MFDRFYIDGPAMAVAYVFNIVKAKTKAFNIMNITC